VQDWDTGAVNATDAESMLALRDRIDGVLHAFLDDVRAEIVHAEPDVAVLVDEIRRLVDAGGKRLRPAFCYWGYRAAGAEDGDAIVRASAALELLHTMALIHDDLMDGSSERRGVPSSAPRLASEAVRLGLQVDPATFGRSAAILAGDLAAVLADRLLLDAGLPPERLAAALGPYHRMRMQMAEGQYLDVSGLAGSSPDLDVARRAARLKGGAYTVAGPLLVGAALAGAGAQATAALQAFGDPLGEAFQLRDDLADGDAAHDATPGEVDALVERARDVLDPACLDPTSCAALDALARSVAMP
jgi:geranylgeranyl diphosphate synthase type I